MGSMLHGTEAPRWGSGIRRVTWDPRGETMEDQKADQITGRERIRDASSAEAREMPPYSFYM
eukprot:3275457-Pyramimonas_sp.AAC.1